MPEIITLATPLTKPNQTLVKLDRIVLDIEMKSIYIQWLGNNGEPGSASYPTPAPSGSSQPSGATLLNQLNTVNLSTTSLVKRILQRLQTDGYIGAGSVTGTPD